MHRWIKGFTGNNRPICNRLAGRIALTAGRALQYRRRGAARSTHHGVRRTRGARMRMQQTWMRLWGAAAVVALAVGLSGCPPTYPKCENDEHCKEKGEYCVQGQCQQCAVDGNCPANFVCQGNKCVPKPECTIDTQCGDAKKCLAGKCVTDPEAGKTPTDPNAACASCAPNEECRNGACVKKA